MNHEKENRMAEQTALERPLERLELCVDRATAGPGGVAITDDEWRAARAALEEVKRELHRLTAECGRLREAEAMAMALVLSHEGRIDKLTAQLEEVKAEISRERHMTKAMADETLKWMRQINRIARLSDQISESMNSTLDELSYSDLRAIGGLAETAALQPEGGETDE